VPLSVAHRCQHHPLREAVARCPVCSDFFCRECITEHDDRVICAACLKKLVHAPERRVRRSISLWPVAQGAGGLFLAWIVLYMAGRLLLAVPDEFHEDGLWQQKLLQFFEAGDE